ncbi:MAG TPA: GAF domain-containing protein [Candidatus Eisenbacteria bacterium]|nr:GAF domain-containing protein [Candidatus Eisenbacteria bacterium]
MDRTESQLESQLGQIERRTTWIWALSAFLMLALACTLLVFYIMGLRELSGMFSLIAPGTQVPIGAGLCGMTALFCLITYSRQRANNRLTRQLFEARLHEDSLRARMFELTSLFDVAGEAHLEEDVDPLLETVCRRLLTCLEADRTSVLLARGESRELTFRAAAGDGAGANREVTLPFGDGIAGWVAQNNEPLILNDEDTLRRFAGETKPGSEIKTAMCIPLSTRGHAIGVINVSRESAARPFTAADSRLLTTFAEHIAAAIQRIEDLAAIDRVRRTLDRDAREIAARNRAKEVFLEAANEDLRGPLTCILAYGEFLSREDCDLDGEKRASFGRILNDQARRLADVVAQSAMLLRLDGREAKLDLAPASLNDVVTATVNDTRPAAEAAGIQLVALVEPGLPAASLDSPRLRQGVKALLGKAIQLSETNSTLRVATGMRDSHLTVQIEGSRMSVQPKDLARAIELGEDGPTAPNRNLLGLELGLHLLKRVVELHGGRIWAECSSNGHTVFAFEVPLPKMETASAPAESATPSPATPAGIVENGQAAA